MARRWIETRAAAVTLSVAACVLWGSAFPVIKTCFADMGLVDAPASSRIAFAGMRFFLASVFIALFARFGLGLSLATTPAQRRKMMGIGLFQTTLLYAFFFNGLAVTAGMKSAILNASGSFFTVLLAHAVFHDDRMGREKVAGLVFGFAGVAAVHWGEGFTWTFAWRGEGFILLCCLFAAIGDILIRKTSEGEHPVLLNAGQMMAGSLVLLVMGAGRIGPVLRAFGPRSWILFLYAALLSAVAFSLWFIVLKYHRAGEVALFRFVIPLAGAGLSAAFLPGESFRANMILGLVLVCGGILLVQTRKRPVRHRAQTRIQERSTP